MSDKKPSTSGKGDKPRTINNQNWRDRYDEINWGKSKKQIIPKNKFGIFACHTQDGSVISPEELTAIINGPIAAMQDKLDEELSKPVIINT